MGNTNVFSFSQKWKCFHWIYILSDKFKSWNKIYRGVWIAITVLLQWKKKKKKKKKKNLKKKKKKKKKKKGKKRQASFWL